MSNRRLLLGLSALAFLIGCLSKDAKNPVDPIEGGEILPKVTGLAAGFDTVSGTASLTWTQSTAAGVAGYALYRKVGTRDSLLGRTLAAAWNDSVRTGETRSFRASYWVKAVDSVDKPGPSSDTVAVDVASLDLVRSTLSLLALGTRVVGERLTLLLQFANATRSHRAVAWNLEGESAPLLTRFLTGRTGTDTVSLVPDSAGALRITAAVTDAAGDRWSVSGVFDIGVSRWVVRGLRASYDTASGVASLSWSPVDNPDFAAYLVYRNEDRPDAPALSTLVGQSRSTAFRDTVRPSPDADLKVLYRIRVKDRDEDVGTASQSLSLHAAPQSLVRTAMTFLPLWTNGGAASILDTLRLVVQYDNPTRRNRSLSWTVPSPVPVTRKADLSAQKGSDTLVIVPAQPFKGRVKLSMTDEAGSVWDFDAPLEVLLDAPVPSAGRDGVAAFGDTLKLHGGARDDFGHIVKWEWDIGATGTFKEVSDGATVVIAPYVAGFQSHVLRVTDDDGLTVLDTVRYEVQAYQRRTPIPVVFQGLVLHAYAGRLFAFTMGSGNPLVAWEYLRAEDRWEVVAESPYTRGVQLVRRSGSKVRFGGACGQNYAFTFDIDTKTWNEAVTYLLCEDSGRLESVEFQGRFYKHFYFSRPYRSYVQVFNSDLSPSDSSFDVNPQDRLLATRDRLFLLRPSGNDSLRVLELVNGALIEKRGVRTAGKLGATSIRLPYNGEVAALSLVFHYENDIHLLGREGYRLTYKGAEDRWEEGPVPTALWNMTSDVMFQVDAGPEEFLLMPGNPIAVRAFDKRTGTLRAQAPLPLPFTFDAGAALDGRLYLHNDKNRLTPGEQRFLDYRVQP